MLNVALAWPDQGAVRTTQHIMQSVHSICLCKGRVAVGVRKTQLLVNKNMWDKLKRSMFWNTEIDDLPAEQKNDSQESRLRCLCPHEILSDRECQNGKGEDLKHSLRRHEGEHLMIRNPLVICSPSNTYNMWLGNTNTSVFWRLSECWTWNTNIFRWLLVVSSL